MNNDPLHPTRVTVKAPLSSKGRRAGETEEELLVELEEEAERDRAKRVGVVHTQMPCHPSGRLAERLGATGGGGVLDQHQSVQSIVMMPPVNGMGGGRGVNSKP